MPKDALPNSYPFIWIGGDHNVYAFTTINEIGYEVKFVPSAYLFADYVEQPVDAYEMVIAVADNPRGNHIPADPLTESTIAAIFYDFFRSLEYVIIYICDSSDGRHQARFKKFTSWFYKSTSLDLFKTIDLFKMDAWLPDGDRQTILSGILSQKNPYFDQFVKLFHELASVEK